MAFLLLAFAVPGSLAVFGSGQRLDRPVFRVSPVTGDTVPAGLALELVVHGRAYFRHREHAPAQFLDPRQFGREGTTAQKNGSVLQERSPLPALRAADHLREPKDNVRGRQMRDAQRSGEVLPAARLVQPRR